MGKSKIEQHLKLVCGYVEQLREAKEKGALPCKEAVVKLDELMAVTAKEEIVFDGFSHMCYPYLKLFGMLDIVISLSEWARDKLGMDSEAGVVIEKNLKTLYRVRVVIDEVEKRYNEQLLKAERTGNKDEIVNQCDNLGGVYVSRDEFDLAEEVYRKALDVEEQRGNEQGIALQFGYLGMLYAAMRNLDDAEVMIKKALGIYEKSGMEKDIGIELCNLSFVYGKREKKGKVC
ncbi:MAG: tetratricopeptide repeat protein [Planctomycetota bacterium]